MRYSFSLFLFIFLGKLVKIVLGIISAVNSEQVSKTFQKFTGHNTVRTETAKNYGGFPQFWANRSNRSDAAL